jgi:hypothetical protein
VVGLFLGGRVRKGVGVQGWQICHPRVLTVLKSGRLKLLSPSVPVQTCTGIVSPYFLKCTGHFNEKRIKSGKNLRIFIFYSFNFFTSIILQNMQYTYNMTFRIVRAIIAAVEK